MLRSTIGEAIWIVAGIVVLMAFGDELVLLALALAIAAMATAWWIHQRHVIKASGHASSRRPSAA
jgi:hypothetical protein